MANIEEIRAANETMARALFDLIEIPFEETTETERQVLACFAFGMAFAVARLNKLSPPETHALAIGLLMDAFKYADHQAVAFASTMVRAASGAGDLKVMNGIMHKGIDGYNQWERGLFEQLRQNIESVLISTCTRDNN